MTRLTMSFMSRNTRHKRKRLSPDRRHASSTPLRTPGLEGSWNTSWLNFVFLFYIYFLLIFFLYSAYIFFFLLIFLSFYVCCNVYYEFLASCANVSRRERPVISRFFFVSFLTTNGTLLYLTYMFVCDGDRLR